MAENIYGDKLEILPMLRMDVKYLIYSSSIPNKQCPQQFEMIQYKRELI